MKKPMPRFGIFVGLCGVALAVGALLVEWDLIRPRWYLLVPALLSAVVAFARGAWRVAAIAAFLCLCAVTLAPLAKSLSDSWSLALAIGVFMIATGSGAWLFVNQHRRTVPQGLQPLASWLTRIRCKVGVTVGTLSMALGVLVWWRMWELFGGGETISVLVEPGVLMSGTVGGPLAYFCGVTALACGAPRTGLLGMYLGIGTVNTLAMAADRFALLMFFMMTWPANLLFVPVSPFLFKPLHFLFQPWLAAVSVGFLAFNYVRSRAHHGDHQSPADVPS